MRVGKSCRLGKLSVFALLPVLMAGCATGPSVQGPAVSPLQLLLSKSKVEPGHVIRITVSSVASDTTLSARCWGRTAILVPIPEVPGQREGFLAVPLETEPGLAVVAFTIAGPGGVRTWSEPVAVLPRPPYATVRLNIRDFERLPYAAESRIMLKVRQEAGDRPGPRLEPWEWPVAGRFSERFGVKRIYNGGLGTWFHGGYDIAAPGGTLIAAPAEGRVIFTSPFKAHGNTILIDHGYGVITTYLHLRKIYVQAGDEVRPGQPIGEVGSTGGSTADHLHFQVNVNGLIADPADFLLSK